MASTASDLTLSIKLKKDGTFNGRVQLIAFMDHTFVDFPEVKTLTTSYATYSIVVPSSALVLDRFLTLKIAVSGTAGYIYADTFSYSQ